MNFKDIKLNAKNNLKGKYFKYFLISLLAFLLCIEIKFNFSQIYNHLSMIQISYIMVLIGILIRPLYITGVKKTYLSGDFSSVKDYFKVGKIKKKNICATFLLRKIIVFISFLIFVIPGIYKALEYIFVPYILTENTDINPLEALKESSRLTKGKKLMLLRFVLSFSLWYILGFFCIVIGILFVNPYFEMSLKELYEKIKLDKI